MMTFRNKCCHLKLKLIEMYCPAALLFPLKQTEKFYLFSLSCLVETVNQSLYRLVGRKKPSSSSLVMETQFQKSNKATVLAMRSYAAVLSVNPGIGRWGCDQKGSLRNMNKYEQRAVFFLWPASSVSEEERFCLPSFSPSDFIDSVVFFVFLFLKQFLLFVCLPIQRLHRVFYFEK